MKFLPLGDARVEVCPRTEQPTSSSWPTGCRSTGSPNPDGSPGWRRSPGGLVTAIEPIMRANNGAWIGWPGDTDEDLEPFEDDGMALVPIALSEDEIEDSTRASPTPPCGRSTTTWSPSRSSTASGGTPTSTSTSASPSTPPSGPRRTPPSGCTTTSCSWCPRCCASCAPTSGSASTCTSRSRRPSSSSSCRGAVRSSRDCSAPTWSASSCRAAPQNFVRLVRQRVGHKTHRDLVYLPDGRTVRAAAFPISIDSEGFEELARSEEVAKRATEIRTHSATRPRCSSASTGSTTPRASTRGCARSAS